MRLVKPLVILVIMAIPAWGTTVEVWLTRGDQASLLEQRPDLTFQAGSGSHGTKVTIDVATKYQSMDGFGASVTESSAWLIQNELSSAARADLLEELFSSSGGLGLSAVRICMGSSDFALSPFTYDDMPAGQSDWNLDNFSISRDASWVIPTLQEALGLNSELKLMASPWSPPAWMKGSGTLFGGSLDWACHNVYADYFVRFVQGYQSYGLPIAYVTAQNEPLNSSGALPSSSMSTYQQSTFIGDYLGPAFAAAGIEAKIICFDHNWEDWNYAVVVLNDPEAAVYSAGAAFHGYAGDVSAQSTVHDFFSGREVEIHFTEISGGTWGGDFSDNLVWSLRNIIIGATRHWARSVIFWNLALDENHGPFIPGGCDGCRGVVTIDTGSGGVTREVEYYILGHASKFVRPGARRIASDSVADTVETVAFRNPDGSEVLIALNPSGSSQWFDVVRDGQYFSYRLTRESVATFVWPAAVPGDFDNSGIVDFADIDDGVQGNGNSLFDYLNQPPPALMHDLASGGTSSGVIDYDDLLVLVESLIGSFVGDVNEDYSVTIDDFGVLAPHLGEAAGYFEGDLNGDGRCDLADFALFQRMYGMGS